MWNVTPVINNKLVILVIVIQWERIDVGKEIGIK